MKPKKFAIIYWCIDDIRDMLPAYSDKQLEAWLVSKEIAIQDVTIERGWAAIDSLIEDTDSEPLRG